MSLDVAVYCGLCPDESCQKKLYFSIHKAVIECSNCGQTHLKAHLSDVKIITDPDEALLEMLKSMVHSAQGLKKGSDLIEVHGISNYQCKLLSPLLTRYGMDKEGNAKPLEDLGHGGTADCGRMLGHRAFLIDPEHIEITGYGRDQTGSAEYLEALFEKLRSYHDDEERLVPIHADGDGHCLVHALSRAMTGREIFWHALRENLQNHLQKNLDKYQALFKDFIDQDDWAVIIKEADPYHTSPEGLNPGLGNIHIFALANVLKRPIVLLDSLEGIKNVADYTGVFVPSMVEPEDCASNVPLCVAWSGSGHNHFVPLVGVAGRPSPTIPQALLPNIWGIGETVAMRYLQFNTDGSLEVGGGKPLRISYLRRLISAMEELFLLHNAVSMKLVSDMHFYIYQRSGFVGLHPDVAIKRTKDLSRDGMIFRCLICNALNPCNIAKESFHPGGFHFEVAEDSHSVLKVEARYVFPEDQLTCKYDAERNCLVPYCFPCSWCKMERLRRVDVCGNTIYENGDVTATPAVFPTSCCGQKHHWDGKEYENRPKVFDLKLKINGREVDDEVVWFYGDSDETLNSDPLTVSKQIAEKHFSEDQFDTTRIQDRIHDEILAKLESYGLEDDMFSPSGRNSAQDDSFSELLGDRPCSSSESLGASKSPVRSDPTAKSRKTYLVPKNKTAQKKSASQSTYLDCVQSGSRALDCQSTGGDVKIRISTSDGRQNVLTVSKTLDYNMLQGLVEMCFAIPPSRQVLKMGFPPKLVADMGDDVPLDVKNGDRVMVEIKDEEGKCGEHGVLTESSNDSSSAGNIYLNNNRPAMTANALTAALHAIDNMAKVTRLSVFNYAIRHPELFRPGGAFFEQFRVDVGLRQGQHCQLPLLKGHVFCYNAASEEIELCLEPAGGHYPIGPQVFEHIRRAARASQLEQSEVSRGAVDAGFRQGVKEKGATDVEGFNVRDEDISQPMDSLDLAEGSLPTRSNCKPASEKSSSSVTTKRQQGDYVKAAVKVPKLAPSYTTIGVEPASVSAEEADRKRRELLEILQSKRDTAQSLSR